MSRQWRFTCEGRYQIDTARRWRAECREHPGRYRLPTEAEWEKAARGGLSGQRFPWGETISHAQANYDGNTSNTFGFRIVRSSVH